MPAGMGLSPDGEGAPAGVGLPASLQTLSAVVEPALLSTSLLVLLLVTGLICIENHVMNNLEGQSFCKSCEEGKFNNVGQNKNMYQVPNHYIYTHTMYNNSRYLDISINFKDS